MSAVRRVILNFDCIVSSIECPAFAGLRLWRSCWIALSLGASFRNDNSFYLPFCLVTLKGPMHLPMRAIAVFHAAARAGSISRAAQELSVTPSAVSQQIASLEVHLGTSLMVKRGRHVVLTEAGERYFEMIAENLDRISDATQNVRGYLSVKSLTVRATPSLSTKWLLPRLNRFLDANPNIEVRLDATNEPTDFSREGVDIEIRHGEGNWPGSSSRASPRNAFFRSAHRLSAPRAH